MQERSITNMKKINIKKIIIDNDYAVYVCGLLIGALMTAVLEGVNLFIPLSNFEIYLPILIALTGCAYAIIVIDLDNLIFKLTNKAKKKSNTSSDDENSKTKELENSLEKENTKQIEIINSTINTNENETVYVDFREIEDKPKTLKRVKKL
jgi:uncharacterized protein YacL